MREPLLSFEGTTMSEQEPALPSYATSETLLSEQLLKLGFHDRNEIEEEIHGVRCRAVEETPELVREALDKFDRLLNEKKEEPQHEKLLRNVLRVSDDATGANLLETNYDGCYLNDPDVRLCFLRCELFAVEKAVERLVLFLEVMTELFGDFVADRPVKRSDFSFKENAALKKSRMQFLPFRDRSGRRALVGLGHVNLRIQPAMLILKISMYMHWINANDVETQRKGVALHIYPGQEWDKSDVRKADFSKREVMMWKKTYECLPVRLVARHHYYKDTPKFRFQATFAAYFLPPEIAKIMKVHLGEETELLYKMSSYGVPVDVLPLTSSRALKFSNHCAWLDVMEKIESGSFDREVVPCPSMTDVTFRMGTGFAQKNPGNAYFLELIHSYNQEFFLGNQQRKKAIVALVYDAILRENGRCLEWWKEGDTWVVIRDPNKVHRKIDKVFRFKNKSLKQKAQTRKLEETITVSSSLIRSFVENEDPKPVSALQEYYSKVHPSKRRKMLDCACITGNQAGDSNACFGKTFFPVDN